MTAQSGWRERDGVAIPSIITIYALADPITGKVRYIGKTCSPQKRLHLHIHEARAGNATPKCAWIRSLLDIGQRPVLVALEEAPYTRAQHIERWWMTMSMRAGWDLTNVAAGGGGPQ